MAAARDDRQTYEIVGVPLARTLINAPVGFTTDSGIITLGPGDAARGGAIFTILVSPRNCDRSESLRAQEFYRGALEGGILAAFEPAQNVTLPGTVTMRFVTLPGAHYAKPAYVTAENLADHEALARCAAGAVRTRITDAAAITLALPSEYHVETEADVLEGEGPYTPHVNESFRTDGQVIFLEVTVANVPAAALAAATPIGLVTVAFRYQYVGRHPPAIDA